MPRYFFHTVDGHEERDPEGVELSDAGAARKEAIRYAGAVMQDEPDVLWDGRDFRVNVVDAEQRLVVTVVSLAVDAVPQV